MRSSRMVCLVAGMLMAGVTLAQAPSASQAALEKMKSLAGVWEGTGGDGKPTTVSYRVTSGGSAVEEVIKSAEEEMVTMYYVDGNRLLMTHYCAAKNQPRMAAGPLDGNKLEFKFVDATNLSSPGTGHMHGLVFTFVDAMHITQQWTGGKRARPTQQTCSGFPGRSRDF